MCSHSALNIDATALIHDTLPGAGEEWEVGCMHVDR
jgi:hypothetical protein